MTDELDRSSTDALHWAEQFCKTLIKISKVDFRAKDIDVGWVQGWFANYWAAVHDSLQNQIYELEKPEKVKIINDFVYVRKDVILNILNEIENEKENGNG